MMMQGSQTQRAPHDNRSGIYGYRKESSLNRDLKSAQKTPKGQSGQNSRERGDQKSKNKQHPPLYELSSLESLKKKSTTAA